MKLENVRNIHLYHKNNNTKLLNTFLCYLSSFFYLFFSLYELLKIRQIYITSLLCICKNCPVRLLRRLYCCTRKTFLFFYLQNDKWSVFFGLPKAILNKVYFFFFSWKEFKGSGRKFPLSWKTCHWEIRERDCLSKIMPS